MVDALRTSSDRRAPMRPGGVCMSRDSALHEQPKRRGWDRRADRGRRMVRDRRREAVAVPVERRRGVERRTEGARRMQGGRRISDPEGFQRLNL